MAKHICEAIHTGVFVLDGGMGTAVQAIDTDIDRDYLGRENAQIFLQRAALIW